MEFDSTHRGVSGQDWDRRCPLPSSKKGLQTHKAKNQKVVFVFAELIIHTTLSKLHIMGSDGDRSWVRGRDRG